MTDHPALLVVLATIGAVVLALLVGWVILALIVNLLPEKWAKAIFWR